MGVDVSGNDYCREFVVVRRRPPEFQQALSREIIEVLGPRASVLSIDAVADAPYNQQFEGALGELQRRARERHEHERQESKWYKRADGSPSLLAIHLDPEDPADFRLFKDYAFYSIHAEVRGLSGGAVQTIFEVEDSGLTVWTCLTRNEVLQIERWVEGHGVSFEEALEPWPN